MTGEHPVSECVLEELAEDGRTVEISGFAFTGDASRRLPISRLESKILCDRHNSCLSPLDEEARSLFKAFVEAPGRLERGERHVVLFSGEDLERWLLKCLCGVAAGGTSPEVPRGWSPPDAWIYALFSQTSITPPAGVAFWVEVGGTLALDDKLIAMGPAVVDGAVEGFGISIAGFEYVLGMTSRTLAINGAAGRQRSYRPGGFEITCARTGGLVSIALGWQGRCSGDNIRMEHP